MTHDWAFILGPTHCNCLGQAQLIGNLVDGFGVALMCAAVFLCVLTAVPRMAASPGALNPPPVSPLPPVAPAPTVATPDVPDWRPAPGLAYAAPIVPTWVDPRHPPG